MNHDTRDHNENDPQQPREGEKPLDDEQLEDVAGADGARMPIEHIPGGVRPSEVYPKN